jgi:hypothetical protein
MRVLALPWIAVMAFCSCGGNADTGAQGDASAPDAREEASTDGAASDSPLGPCEGPGGYAVCGGPNDCYPAPGPSTPECNECLVKAGAVGLCLAVDAGYIDPCNFCDDGDVCVDASGANSWVCAPFAVGQLFASNGASAQVRYTDLSLWTGDSLPEPTDCSAPAGLTYCGGNCGGCPTGEGCVGRSPLHPYGLCLSTAPSDPTDCASGDVAFAFEVQPSAQALANRYAVCMPSAECATAAASYPGGALCTP